MFENMEKIAFDIHKILSDKMLQGIELSLSQSHIFLLRYIKCKGRCMISDIANHLGITLSAVTSLSDKLCTAGLVTRLRGENDRRVVYLEITEGGKNILNSVDENWNRVFEKAFSNLSSEEINYFFSTIEKITKSIIESDFRNN